MSINVQSNAKVSDSFYCHLYVDTKFGPFFIFNFREAVIDASQH